MYLFYTNKIVQKDDCANISGATSDLNDLKFESRIRAVLC